METKEFWQQLEARISKYDLLCHPFYQAWSQGQLTRDDLRSYAAEYFHHVAEFPEYLSAFHARLAPGSLAHAVLENQHDEEGIGSPDGRSHAELWMDFAEGMGGSRTPGSEPLTEVGELMQTFHKIAREGSPAQALAAFYAYESQVPRVAKEKARGLREMYAADARTCGYFTLHMTADVHHAEVWREQLENHFQGSGSESQEKALDAAELAARSLWSALDGIERQRLERAAA